MEGFVIEQIVLAHHFIAPPGWVGEDHARIRSHHGIIYVLQGLAEYRLRSGETFTICAGDCLYFPSGTGYIVRCMRDEAFDHLTVNFSMKDALFPQRTLVRFSAPTQFEQTFFSLIRHWSLRHDFYRERCMAHLYEMTWLMLREAYAGSQRHRRLLEPARAYLDEHFAEDFPLSLLPSLCGLSPTYFHRLFREVFHETPGDTLRRLRVARARDLLLGGFCSISKAAELCGYEDPAYFSRMFKKTLGESPAQYIRERKL